MLSILGIGDAQPDNIIDNQFIEDLDIGTNAEWIIAYIGIENRRTSLPLDYIKETRNEDPREAVKLATHTPTDLGASAAELALKRAGITPDQVGMLITNCCTPLQIIPSESQRIANRLGCDKARAFDVFSACPAFALHIDFLNRFDESNLPDYILCISTATLTHNVNYNERSDAAIWGDGAAAWVVSPTKQGRLGVTHSFFTADPTRCQSVVVDTFGHFHQDGRAVRDFSVRQTVRLVRKLEKTMGLDWSKDIFVGHQANKTMLFQITKNRKIPDTNHWHNVTDIGNQAGAGAPATISAHWDEIKSGQKIVVAVVGAGLSWGSVVLEAH